MSVPATLQAVPTEWEATEMFVMKYASTASLALLIYDVFATFHREVECIWGKKLTPIRYVYLFCRYGGLAVQIINQVVTFVFHSKLVLSYSTCKAWYIGRIVTSQTMLTTLSGICLHRAYYFQGRKTSIGIIFLSLMCIEIGLVIARIQTSWDDLEFTVGCLVKSIPDSKILIGLGAFINQSVFAISLITQNIRDLPRAWKRRKVITLVKRDGILAFVAVVGPAIATSIIYQSSWRHDYANVLAGIISSLFLTIVSVISCRLITNLLLTPGVEDPSMMSTIISASLDEFELGEIDGRELDGTVLE